MSEKCGLGEGTHHFACECREREMLARVNKLEKQRDEHRGWADALMAAREKQDAELSALHARLEKAILMEEMERKRAEGLEGELSALKRTLGTDRDAFGKRETELMAALEQLRKEKDAEIQQTIELFEEERDAAIRSAMAEMESERASSKRLLEVVQKCGGPCLDALLEVLHHRSATDKQGAI